MLYRIARELADAGKKVCVTTTTKMFLPSAEHAEQGCPDAVLIKNEYVNMIEGLKLHFEAREDVGKVVFVASKTLERSEPDSRIKVQGIPEEWPGRLLAEEGLCDAVIVEADGARHCPFKAPGPHEPCIPAESTAVVAVAGVDALGTALHEDNVCRASMVAGVTGHTEGDIVDAGMVSRVLGDRGLWKVPPGSAFVAVVNKCDDEDRIQLARAVVDKMDTLKERIPGPDAALICGNQEGQHASTKHSFSFRMYEGIAYSL